MIRAIGYLLSELVWTLVFKLAPPQRFDEDDDPQSAADATAARTRWIRDHLPPEGR